MPTTSALNDPVQETIDDLKYSLAKRVPNMMGGFTIQTMYGDIHIDSEFAEHFQILVKTILNRRLNKLITL